MKKDRTYFSIAAIAACVMLAVADIIFDWSYLLIVSIFPDLSGQNWILFILNDVLLYGLGGLICWLILRILPKKKLICNRMTAARWFRFFCIAELFMLVGSLIGTPLNSALSRGSTNEQEAMNQLLSETNVVVVFVVLSLVAPIMEELIFRKLMIDRLIVFGDAAAICFSALIFALAHQTFYQFFYAFLVGIILGYVYIRTGNVRYNMLLHVMLNFCGAVVPQLFSVFGVTSSGIKSGVPISAGTIALSAYEYLLIVIYILGLVFLLQDIWRRPRLCRGERSMPFALMAKAMFVNVGMPVFIAYSVYRLIGSIT